MKTCTNCGKEMADDIKFCTECGTAIEEAAPAAETAAMAGGAGGAGGEAGENGTDGADAGAAAAGAAAAGVAADDKKKKTVKLALIIGGIVAALAAFAVVAVIAIVIIFAILMNKTNKLDMNDYVRTTFTGYDTVGRVSVSFDYDKFVKEFVDEKGLFVDEDKARRAAVVVANSVSIYVDKYSALTNGEEVTYKVTVPESDVIKEYLEECKIELETKNSYFKVKDLQALTDLNPFDYITITQEGIDGDVSVYISKEDDSYVDDYISLDVDNRYNLSIGDKVTITVPEAYITWAAEDGYRITATTYEYTVGDADKYYTSVDQFALGVIDLYKNVVLDEINSYLNSNSSEFTGTNITYVGTYVLSNLDAYNKNYIIPVYSVDITSLADPADFEPATVYMSFKLYNAIDRLEGEDTWYESSWDIEGGSGLKYGWWSWYEVKGYASLNALCEGLINPYVEDGYNVSASAGLPTEPVEEQTDAAMAA